MGIDKEKMQLLLKSYKYSILLLILLIAVILLQKMSLAMTLFSCVSLTFVFFLIFMISRVKNGVIRYMLGTVVAALFTLDAVCAIAYNSRVTSNIIAAIMETDYGEAVGMLRDISIYIIFIGVVVFFLTYRSIKELRAIETGVLKVSFYTLILFLFFALCSFFHQDETDFGRAFTDTVYCISTPRMSVLYSDVLSFLYCLRDKSNYKAYLDSKRVLETGMSYNLSDQISQEKMPDKIFLIIGESASSAHFSLYGYPVRTTPFLDSLSSDTTSGLFYYPAITSHLFTRDAVQMMLSARSPLSKPETFFQTKNLIELGIEAEYEVIWVSNQKILGSYEGFISVMTAYATHRKHNFRREDGELKYNDLELIPIAKEFYKEGKKQLFIFHQEGSHRAFSARYDDIDQLAIEGNNDVVDYDRTVHHTDRFLKEIYSMMSDNSVMCYVSDHGEYPESARGRFDTGGRAYNIPMVYIDKSDLDIDEIVTSYKSDEIGMLNNSNIYYIISELMGYTVSEEKKNRLREESKYIEDIYSSILTLEEVKLVEY